MKKFAIAASGLGLLGLLAWATWHWQHQEQAGEAGVAPTSAAASAPPAPVIAAAASAPSIKYPISAPAAAASAAASAPAPDAESAMTELFGRKTVLKLFQLDDFARRVVATVDNLGRSHAASRLWPVNPAEGRFLTDKLGDTETISADNSLRYTPYVLLIESVDLHQLAAAYRKLYPMFQNAYVELGYPKQYFNDRLVEVLDQLLATPSINGPILVRLPVIDGPTQPPRPWVLYEFADPALESLSAGQKILLRAGPVNERRLKAKLTELRGLLAAPAPRS